MKLPRDLGGAEFAHLLEKVGYRITRQTGSHLRLTRVGRPPHHVTIPRHKPLRVGTLNNILNEIAQHMKIGKWELLEQLLNS